MILHFIQKKTKLYKHACLTCTIRNLAKARRENEGPGTYGRGTPRISEQIGGDTLLGILGRDPRPDNEYLLKRCEQYAAGRCVFRARASPSLRYRSSNDDRHGDATAATRALSRRPGPRAGPGDILRDPRYRAEVASSGQRTYTNERTSITERRLSSSARSIRIRARALPCIRYCAPVYLPSRFLASSRNEDRSFPTTRTYDHRPRRVMPTSSANGLFPTRSSSVCHSLSTETPS